MQHFILLADTGGGPSHKWLWSHILQTRLMTKKQTAQASANFNVVAGVVSLSIGITKDRILLRT